MASHNRYCQTEKTRSHKVHDVMLTGSSPDLHRIFTGSIEFDTGYNNSEGYIIGD